MARLPQGKRRNELQHRVDHLSRTFECKAIAPKAADVYARLRLEAQMKGTPLGENDLWIASTAILIGAILVTRDNDFNGIDGWVIEDWAA